MTCDVTGHPAPQVTWYKDGQKLEPQLAKVTDILGYVGSQYQWDLLCCIASMGCRYCFP